MRNKIVAFQKLNYKTYPKAEIIKRSNAFLNDMKKRRTVRDFSSKSVPLTVITDSIKVAASAPSGANKQPWHFVIVQNNKVKKQIRIAAEKEEKAFYEYRAPREWLEDLNQFGTDWRKPFLERAPYLIVVFKKSYNLNGGKRKKNYYVNESVGIASGFLLAALHQSGLATLTHTPSPMGFLEKILNRPKNEKAVLLIPVGYPSANAEVPQLIKKQFDVVCTIT